MPASAPLKIGFLGGGINSAVGNTHRIASQMDNRFILAAGCFSKNGDINAATAEEYKVASDQVYEHWLKLLESEQGNLDAVCILTPTDIHTEMVVTALNMGYTVICEKALANNYEDAIKICTAVNENNGFLAVTYNYTGYPMLRELRQMIIDDNLGQINQIHVEMPQEGFACLDKDGQWPKPQTWRLVDGVIPTVSLDLGVHLHNMIYFLTGAKPLEVIAEYDTYGYFKNIVDNVICIARYSGQMRAQIWYSKSALGHRNGLRVRVYGDKGSAEWFQMQPEQLLCSDIYGKQATIDRAGIVKLADEPRYTRFKAGHPAGFIEAFANHYYDIAACLIDYKKRGDYSSPFVFDGVHAKDGLEMLEAISLSAKNSSWQAIKSNLKMGDE